MHFYSVSDIFHGVIYIILSECVRQGALLTLYTNILLKLSSCQSPVQEMSVLTDVVTWCSQIKMK